MLRSSDYTFLIPASALLGALVMEVIDIVARVVIPPAELPVGIITAVVGAPVFLWILLRAAAPGKRGRSMVELRGRRRYRGRRRADSRRRERPLSTRPVQRHSRAERRGEVHAASDRDGARAADAGDGDVRRRSRIESFDATALARMRAVLSQHVELAFPLPVGGRGDDGPVPALRPRADGARSGHRATRARRSSG